MSYRKKTGREAAVLRQILGRHYEAVQQKRNLEERLEKLSRDGYTSVSLANQQSEIKLRIEDQKRQVEAALIQIMDILDYLDPISEERMVLELRYIDNLPWSTIEKRVHMSRSTCYNKQCAGIRQLLSFKRVREIVKKYSRKQAPGG